MSKRLFIPFMVVLMLMLTTVAHAQEAPVAPVLTEDQINQEFTIPSTAARKISNLIVDVHQDGVQISFDMTVVHDGTSNTISIIAVLIGLQVSEVELENPMISSYQATRSQRLEVIGLVERAWNNYIGSVFGDASADLVLAEGFIMSDGRICDPIRHMGC